MEGKIKYDFTSKVWKHAGTGGWYFVSLPKGIAKEIREHLQWQEEGWGRMKANAQIESANWETAIWFDKKQNTYLLPLKAEVRRRANIKVEDTLTVTIFI